MQNDADKTMEQRYLEDVVEAVERLLSAPLPMVTASRENDYKARVDLALDVLTGLTHPGDVIAAPIESLDEQAASMFLAVKW